VTKGQKEAANSSKNRKGRQVPGEQQMRNPGAFSISEKAGKAAKK